MTNYCDFSEQVSIIDEETNIRPDLTVNLAGGKKIVVDAKTPMEAYLNVSEFEDVDYKNSQLNEHLRQTKDHITSLSSKSYYRQFPTSPELVIMFIPNDSMFMSALDQDPGLMEWAGQKNVFLASPITLIAVLKAVAVGWREESLAKNAAEISELGKQLYDRLSVFSKHFKKVRSGLDRAVSSFNDAVSSLESRVFVTARRFRDFDVIEDKSEELQVLPIDRNTRELNTEETQIPLLVDEEKESSIQ